MKEPVRGQAQVVSCSMNRGDGIWQGAAPPQEAVSSAGDGVDEQLARLAKLGQLRDSGVLTPEEFEQQKRRILEG